MSETKHTPEPWSTVGGAALPYTQVIHGSKSIGKIAKPEDARRVMVCVNACVEMADPAAEITRLRDELAEARKVVGLLVEACEARVVQCKNDTKFCRWHVLVGDRIYSRNPSRHKATESLYWMRRFAVKKAGGGA